MTPANYQKWMDQGLRNELLSRSDALTILESPQIELLPLLNSAYQIRKHFKGNSVMIHIINNGQNGFCPEDCGYCAQAKSSKANIEEYPIKSDAEFLAEAKNAYEKGAYRYCMVFAGRGPSVGRVKKLAQLIRDIKAKYPIEICVSAGLLDDDKAQALKDAGLDRLNHNLNTSEKQYPSICSTHTYQDRLNTLAAGRKAGIQLCSGMIVGMNESLEDIVDVAYKLRELKVESIPVNFLIPIPGAKLESKSTLTPEFCLRVLCLFRFLNPQCELRVAAGREYHLRGMEVMALYPANSLFLDGYLNTKGTEARKTLQMIKDAGFTIASDHKLEDILGKESGSITHEDSACGTGVCMKDLKDLRPHIPTFSQP